jgi:hypothetical protein
MRLAATLTLALSVALAAPIAAYPSDSMRPIHKHRTHGPKVAHAWVHPSATTLAPAITIAPVAPAPPDNDSDGLSRNPDDCNRGCIDNN